VATKLGYVGMVALHVRPGSGRLPQPKALLAGSGLPKTHTVPATRVRQTWQSAPRPVCSMKHTSSTNLFRISND